MTTNLSSGDIYLSSEADVTAMVVSRDGTLTAYQSDESGRNEIYIRYATSDGSSLMAADLRRDPGPVVVSRSPLLLMGPDRRLLGGLALHPNGDRFIMARDMDRSEVEGFVPEPEYLILVTNGFEELDRQGER